MAYSDLQDYLGAGDQGKLHWVDKPVDPSWEVSAVGRCSTARVGPLIALDFAVWGDHFQIGAIVVRR
jgi:hypothetical protein